MLLSLTALGATAAGGLAAEPTIEVTGNSLATYAWTPASAAVDGGGSVTFKNATANFHGLVWESGPEAPSCTGTPSVGQANWSGSCTFAQGGTYHFYCPVHPAQMKGTVTVSGPAAPVVSTGSASALSETEATLNGTVNPSEQATTYLFEYGATAAYGQKTSEEPAGSGTSPVPESATVSALSAGTTYHFRLVAKNATGTSHGLDRTFRTAGGTSEPPPTTEPPPVQSPAPSPSSPPLALNPAPPAIVISPATVDTKFTLKPRAKTKDRTPTFKFTATTPGATFRCSLDGKAFKACRSPYTTPSLKPGRHTVRVAAVANGLTDPTPAAASFKVLAKKN
ncbi:MAG TPA: plastocyanin/azurin family copper-binding protein [Solirubrobacterales bacterium]|nr:plastocyanin/azurin family copper-binding protein [Solirubrobacterales bacterium]